VKNSYCRIIDIEQLKRRKITRDRAFFSEALYFAISFQLLCSGFTLLHIIIQLLLHTLFSFDVPL